jgi:large subunit ribosomal protein L21
MKKYAVVKVQGHQYKVSEGEEFLVDKIEGEVNSSVLLVVDGENVTIGKPVLEKAQVKLSVLGQEKGEKIDVFKYKAKSRYRKHTGFRPQLTRLKVDSINL